MSLPQTYHERLPFVVSGAQLTTKKMVRNAIEIWVCDAASRANLLSVFSYFGHTQHFPLLVLEEKVDAMKMRSPGGEGQRSPPSMTPPEVTLRACAPPGGPDENNTISVEKSSGARRSEASAEGGLGRGPVRPEAARGECGGGG